MKTIKNIFIPVLLYAGMASAQNQSSCTNGDFELGNFSNWVGKTGWCFPITMTNNGFAAGRHTIMSGAGTDPFSLGLVPVVPPGGGNYSVRLGNSNVGSEAEQLIYAFTVTANTALFIYRYAVVLEDPGHPANEQPRFSINVFDQNGLIIPCGAYNVVASGSIPGFFNNGTKRIKPWTTVGIDLSPYIGQNVRIEFTTADCGYGGHFGYAYMECYCSPFQIVNDFCPGLTTATLQAPIGFANYLWTTGDTTSAITINNPANGATYSVTMTSVTGCQVTLTTILQQTSIFSNFYPSTTCFNHVSFIDSSYVVSGSNINHWNWDFGDGTTSSQQYPIHAFPDSGIYNVTLIVTNMGGCIDSITIPVQTQPIPSSNFSFTPGCPGAPIDFTDLSTFLQGTITNWYWNFGDGTTDSIQDPAHSYSGGTSFNASLVTVGDNGCMDTIHATVDLFPAPAAGFTPPAGCLGSPLSFHDSSSVSVGTITNFQWDFGNGTTIQAEDTSFAFLASGTHNVTLTVTSSDGCLDSVSWPVAVYPLPQPDFNFIPACLHSPIQFYDNSTISSGTIQNYVWQFGDTTSLTGTQVAHAYSTPGPHAAWLYTTSNHGCMDSATHFIQQYPLPAALFDAAAGCPNTPLPFADLSTVAGGTISGYAWDFGDSTQSTEQYPSHTFSLEGTYQVTLIVQSIQGCMDTAVAAVVVNPAPVADFSAEPVCLNDPTLFTDLSYFVSGSITSWTWDYGDGSALSTERHPNHTFLNAGVHDVTLYLTASNGCTNLVVLPADVYPPPHPAFTAAVACLQESMTFINLSSVDSGTIDGYTWIIDDSIITLLPNTSYQFNDLEPHEVTLIATSSYGCMNAFTQQVAANPLPMPRFDVENICYPGTASFTDASHVIPGFITQWDWDFGDNTPGSSYYHSLHDFPSTGTYSVTLTVTTDKGCKDEITVPVTIYEKPIADFEPMSASGCAPFEAAFYDRSLSPDGAIMEWIWDFGNGTTDSASTGTTVYDQSGTYSVNLIGISEYGCRDTVTYVNVITIYPSPEADFSLTPASTSIYDPTINYFDESSGAIFWTWDFGDQSTSNQLNPVHHYTEPGIYDVVLTVLSDKGCPDMIVRKVEIRPEYMYVVPNAFTPNGDGVNDSFIGQGIGIREFRMSIFDRWGQLLYETSSETAPWDGKYKDRNVQNDVYVYKIEITDVLENYHEFIGSVTVAK